MPNALNTLHLFYTNIIVQKYNKIVFNKTIGPTFKFEVIDIHYHSCPITYKLLDDPSKTSSLHVIICMKQNMIIELCVGNYALFDGLVNEPMLYSKQRYHIIIKP